MSLFKAASSVNEILLAMQKNLISNQTESQYGFNKVAQAIDYLNEAATIFEQAQMTEIAEDITQVLESLANK